MAPASYSREEYCVYATHLAHNKRSLRLLKSTTRYKQGHRTDGTIQNCTGHHGSLLVFCVLEAMVVAFLFSDFSCRAHLLCDGNCGCCPLHSVICAVWVCQQHFMAEKKNSPKDQEERCLTSKCLWADQSSSKLSHSFELRKKR